MKTALSIIALLTITANSISQPISTNQSQADSIQLEAKRLRTSGSIFLPVGIAFIAGGAALFIHTHNNDPTLTNPWFPTEPESKPEGQDAKYLGSALMIVGGVIATCVGASKLKKSRRLLKSVGLVGMSLSPGFVPYTSGGGQFHSIMQTSFSLTLSLGK